MSNQNIDEEHILNLWRDISFPASFRGAFAIKLF